MGRRFALVGMALLAGLLLAACGKTAAPEQVALEYGRAVYADDAAAIWRLVSEADRRLKDEPTFRRQQRQLPAFAREVVGDLARLVTTSPVQTTIVGNRARVTLRFRLPDANAPEIRTLMQDWDEDRLERLAAAERRRLRERLQELGGAARIPTVEGEETIELVREAAGWRVFLNWAGGVTVRFSAAVDPGVPLRVTLAPASVVLAPGERIRVTVRAENPTAREITTRVGHRIEPAGRASHLALLQCPLFVPVTLGPGESREFASEYLLLADVPRDVKAFEVAYWFPDGDGGRPR